MGITPNGRKAYVLHSAVFGTNDFLHTVTPVRVSARTAGNPITVGKGPWAIAITPDSKTTYVANAASGSVTPIRIATNKARKAIKAGKNPIAIALACRS